MASLPVTGATVDVLALLLRAFENGDAEVHGWLIMKATRRPGPTVFGVLDRLEDAGWVAGSWEVLEPGEQRPRRRYYRLTATGVEAAREHVPTPAPRPRRRLRPRLGFGRVADPRLLG